MEHEDTPPVSNSRTPPSNDELVQALEGQRAQLKEIRAIVDSQAKLMHETYDFEMDEADLGLCCDAVRDMLERIHARLGAVIFELQSQRHIAPTALAHFIEAPRQELFRAWAVASAIENLLRLQEPAASEADLRSVMVTVVRMMDDTLNAIEPLTLGLPIPIS